MRKTFVEIYTEEAKKYLNTSLTQEGQLANLALGLNGEAGEVGDLLKKNIFQGHPLDTKKIAEEIGDCMWYIVNLCDQLNLDLETIMTENLDKLAKRYPQGKFDVTDSILRRDK